MTQQNLPGLDLDRLGAWLRTAIPEAGTSLTARVLAGGKSNLTYQISDGATSWILRRPPLGHVLATAHDMSREFRFMSALHGTDVPVPRMYAIHEDPSLLGAPFYVMEHIDGVAYRLQEELEPLGSERTKSISVRLVDTLIALHRVDPAAAGLSGLGRTEGFLTRQVHRWRKQIDASHTRHLHDADALYRRLESSVPSQSPAGIVHGDFRLDNILIDASDHPRAVIDWEMATLGDPLTDLALMLIYHRLGDTLGDLTVATAPGFLTEAQIIAHYGEGGERDLTHFGFYLALASYKLASIVEGIRYRFLQQQTVGDGFDLPDHVVPTLLAGGLAALKEKY